MSVIIDQAAVEELLYAIGGPVMDHVALTAEAIKAVAESLAPVGEGKDGTHLRDTGEVAVTHGLATVAFTSPHALYVEEDTRPHIIRARNAPRLVFYWAKVGKVVAATQVNHPGTKGQHFLLRAAETVTHAPLV